jgi:hypothetical protein
MVASFTGLIHVALIAALLLEIGEIGLGGIG